MPRKKTVTPAVKDAPAKAEPSKVEPARVAEPARIPEPATSTYVMRRSGAADGSKSRVRYSFRAGEAIVTPEGDLDYLGERYIAKK